MTLQTGDELLSGKYRIEKHIGKGGFGSVYLAHDTLLGRQVAIKELLTAMVDDPTVVRRFVAEARVAIDLRHPNIVEVYDVFPEGGNYYIAMEYLAGGSLQDRLRAKGHLGVDEALRIMAQVCAGLAHAHRKGVVHCDVKPANILFTGAGTPKVGDFGIAHISSDLMTRVWRTATQFTAGTMRYMSPEQLEGVRDDPRVDVHALGAVLYEMLAGKPYLDFETESTPAAQMRNMQRIAHEAPRPLPSRVPSWLGAVVAKALRKRPDSRHADAGELGTALQPVGALTIRAEPPAGPAETTTRRAPSPKPAGPRPVPPRRKVKGIPVWFWPAVGGGGAMLVLVLTMVLFAGLGGGPTAPPAATATLESTATTTYTPTASPTNTVQPTATSAPTPTIVPSPTSQATYTVVWPPAGCDAHVDLGDVQDEATHGLQGWASTGVGIRHAASPSGDRTLRYQPIKGQASVELCVLQPGVDYRLITEVQDYACTDNFDIFINGYGPVYSYTGTHSGRVIAHSVLVPAQYIMSQRVEVTFENTSTDPCGAAGTYNVALVTGG